MDIETAPMVPERAPMAPERVLTQGTLPVQTTLVDDHLDMFARLHLLQQWEDEYQADDARLLARVDQLGTSAVDEQKGRQIMDMRQRLLLRLVRSPLDIDPDSIAQIGYEALRRTYVEQFARMTKDQRLAWLANFYFVLTPDLRALNRKLATILQYRSPGQQRNLLLGGESGMGKSTYADWLAAVVFPPTVEEKRNRIPLVKTDAPASQLSARMLLQNIVQAFGATYAERDKEGRLLNKIATNAQKCRNIMQWFDEIENVRSHELRRRFIELSNVLRGVTMVCASCHPYKFTEGDVELQGRWNDYFELKPYTVGKDGSDRLAGLLVFMELLLPFTSDANLSYRQVETGPKKKDVAPGPATLIDELTRGNLNKIMILLVEASRRAIIDGLPCLSQDVLRATWDDLKSATPPNIRALLK